MQRTTTSLYVPLWLIAAAVLATLPLDAARLSAAEAPRKKLIEFGWDTPDTKQLRENVATMEKSPFDGVVVYAMTNATPQAPATHLMWETWGPRTFRFDEFTSAVADLKATPFKTFTDNFVRVNITPGKSDWFDDKVMANVAANFGVAAQIAKQGGVRGLMFDTEQYESQIFEYPKQQHAKTKSHTEYRDKVRQRGQELMRAISAHYPDITIITTFSHEVATWPNNTPIAQANYGMIGDLVDGMLDECGPQATIVNGFELSYGFKEPKEFAEARELMRIGLKQQSRSPEKYAAHLRVGFGLWMDNKQQTKGWNVSNFSTNHFSPEEFEKSLDQALVHSDGYVWLYTEKPRWWKAAAPAEREALPQPYFDAVVRARAKAAAKAASPQDGKQARRNSARSAE